MLGEAADFHPLTSDRELDGPGGKRLAKEVV